MVVVVALVGAVVVVAVGNVVVVATVVVVDGVVAYSTIASTVAFGGTRGVTPAGSKAIVTRRSFTNLMVAGSVVRVAFFWPNEFQYA
jgi:hypothetical protein